MTTDQRPDFLVMLVDYADANKRDWSDFDEAEQAAVMQGHVDFDAAVAAHPECEILSGAALDGPATATVFARRDGHTVLTDGCFAEAFEQFGGFYLIKAPDLGTLTGLLELMPTYVMEIRPTLEV